MRLDFAKFFNQNNYISPFLLYYLFSSIKLCDLFCQTIHWKRQYEKCLENTELSETKTIINLVLFFLFSKSNICLIIFSLVKQKSNQCSSAGQLKNCQVSKNVILLLYFGFFLNVVWQFKSYHCKLWLHHFWLVLVAQDIPGGSICKE